jgi:hypothetical protein
MVYGRSDHVAWRIITMTPRPPPRTGFFVDRGAVRRPSRFFPCKAEGFTNMHNQNCTREPFDSKDDPPISNQVPSDAGAESHAEGNGQHNTGAQSGGAAPDPFSNLDSLRLSQDFAAQAAVRPVFTDISCRRPDKQEFIRVRPGSEWRFETACFKDRLNQETYLVNQELWSALQGELTSTVLFLCMAKHSLVPFLWDIPLPGPDGRWNRWHKTKFEAAQLAETQWLKVVSDEGCYVPHPAEGKFPDPDWPQDLTMADYLRLAFQDRFIQSWDHPALKRLRGEI